MILQSSHPLWQLWDLVKAQKENRNNNNRYNKQPFHQCIICNGRHLERNCIHRGDDWKPKWIIKNAVKYNAMHPTDKPNQEIVNADPPLRQAKRRYQANAAIIENEEVQQLDYDEQSTNNEEVADDLVMETEDHQTDEISPSAGMATKNPQDTKDNRFVVFEDSSSSNGEEEY